MTQLLRAIAEKTTKPHTAGVQPVPHRLGTFARKCPRLSQSRPRRIAHMALDVFEQLRDTVPGRALRAKRTDEKPDGQARADSDQHRCAWIVPDALIDFGAALCCGIGAGVCVGFIHGGQWVVC